MLLFCRSKDLQGGQIIVPLNRVYNIITSDCRININYDSGEMLEVREGIYHKKIDTVSIIYDSADEVDKTVRQFYKSVNNNSNCFYFGGNN